MLSIVRSLEGATGLFLEYMSISLKCCQLKSINSAICCIKKMVDSARLKNIIRYFITLSTLKNILDWQHWARVDGIDFVQSNGVQPFRISQIAN